MSKLLWDQTGERIFEAGVSNGAFYKRADDGSYPLGVAWNGLTSVSESPTGGEANATYADDQKYLNILSREEFEATVEAFTYPAEFEECDGSGELTSGVMVGQQKRKPFGLVYKTKIGNDVEDIELGYKLHIIYNALAAPSEKSYETINENTDPINFSWSLTTTPEEVTGHKPTATIVVDSTKVDAAKLAQLELVLFGDTGVDPRLPLPDEVKTIIEATPSAVALSSIVPNDEATDVAIDTDVVLTFNNMIVSENVLLMTSDGATIVPTTKSWDTTGKILTVNPVSNLSNATAYRVVIDGVVDQYAQLLATDATNNFTTIA